MVEPIGDMTLHAVLEVKRVGLLMDKSLWKVELQTYGGSTFALILYTNGDEPCPFFKGDFYATDDGQHGGWSLIRLPQEEINSLKGSKSRG